jgi:hypothetical protein
MKHYEIKKKEKEILEHQVSTNLQSIIHFGMTKESPNSLTQTQLTDAKKACLKIYETICKIEGYNESSVKK